MYIVAKGFQRITPLLIVFNDLDAAKAKCVQLRENSERPEVFADSNIEEVRLKRGVCIYETNNWGGLTELDF